ncbi:thioredoxin-like protein [Suillus spraguei]|nr:thioredoxin-like protein [Suillus spraguei]
MATKQILRAQLRSYPANGHSAYLPQIRKIVLEYCQKLPSSSNTRIFISNDLQRVAWQNPHVEFVVKQRNGHEPIARGFYVNGRDKVIPLQEFEVNGVEKKVQLLLDSSGAKIKPLKKGRIVESTTEAARGIWSGLHVDTPFKI